MGHRLFRYVSAAAFACLVASVAAPPIGAAAPAAIGRWQQIAPHAGASGATQDPAWLALKNNYQIRLDRSSGTAAIATQAMSPATYYPSYAYLNTSWTQYVEEPLGDYGTDDWPTSYDDANYWKLCAPGALTVASWYSIPSTVQNKAGWYKEPYASWPAGLSFSDSRGAYWAGGDTINGFTTHGRGYILYMAMKVAPPGDPVGVDDWSAYPTSGSRGQNQARDALNWEASGHASNWKNYFWAVSGTRDQATLVADVKFDVYYDQMPVIVSVDTAWMPWWGKSIAHSIAIVGYSQTNQTFTVIDTCGHQCNGSSSSHDGGTYTVSFSAMANALIDYWVW